MNLIGRKQEIATFKHLLNSSESKLVALYGRRRVGKTFLVRNYFGNQIVFEATALHDADMKTQLQHFAETLAKYGQSGAVFNPPQSWYGAFNLLESLLNHLNGRKKKVVFLDELPWFDTPRSGFLSAFERFWNTYCTKRNDLIVVICGSAASWMIKKVLRNKGGLHNRVAEKIRLTQFSLKETAAFLKEKNIKWSLYDIAQLYMTTGGVPYYLDAVRKGESVTQFIDRACFSRDGILTDEYQILFESLFDDSKRHYQVVEALNTRKQGLSRQEIIQKTRYSSGGTLTKILDELEESGFIDLFIPYQKNKTKALYKLVDNFTIFYLKFMKDRPVRSTAKWTNIVKTQSWISWSGLAFERLCFAHIDQIKKALKLEAIESVVAVWQPTPDKNIQIDLLIDRADRIVNLGEIKFAKGEFTIDKAYANTLRRKIETLSTQILQHKKPVFLTMITTFGITQNQYATELIQSEVLLEDLFE